VPAPKGNQFARGAYARGQGRKTTYRPEYAKRAYRMCLLGATDQQLADYFEVSPSCIVGWKKKFEDFRAALRRGREEADAKVAEAVFKRAVGYRHRAKKIFYNRVEDKIVEAEYIEQYPPDTPAGELWLNQRQGWSRLKRQDPPDDEQSRAGLPTNIDLSKLSTETLQRVLDELKAAAVSDARPMPDDGAGSEDE
jgi:hypothetical protein